MDNVNKTYVSLLIDTMKKKVQVLDQIITSSLVQADCFQGQGLDEEKFDQNLEEKEQLISELNQLNDGFEKIYDRIKDTLAKDKDVYKSEIKELQYLIKVVTEKSLEIQKIEGSNRSKFETYVTGKKKEIKTFTVSKKSAAAYYNNMMKQADGQSYFYDNKK